MTNGDRLRMYKNHQFVNLLTSEISTCINCAYMHDKVCSYTAPPGANEQRIKPDNEVCRKGIKEWLDRDVTITHAQKIRLMDDDELARFLVSKYACDCCDGTEPQACNNKHGCLKGIKKWLRSEVNE